MNKAQIIACLCNIRKQIAGLTDKDEQQLSSDGCEISLTNGGSVKLKKKVYTWGVANPGVLEEIWGADGNAAPHDNVSNLFTGSTHVNGAPDISQIVADWNDSTTDDPNNGSDQFQYTGYIYIPADGTQIQDVNSNTGERLRAFVGKGCCPPVVAKEITVNTPSSARGLGIFATLDEGWHKIIFQGSDLSAYGGVQLQIDDAGNGVFANYTGPASVDKPVLECRDEDCDYVLQDGEYDCPQSLSADCDPIEGAEAGLSETDVQVLIDAQDHDDPVACDTNGDLVSDNLHSEGTVFSRTGDAGSSDEYARCDHKHPIVRIPNPGDPVITLAGPAGGTLANLLILDRESDEESYAYKVRALVQQTAGTNWDYLVVPNIAGFQRPEIYGIGTYRNQSTVPQTDDGTFGAAPRGPYMGKEAHEWSSTQRVYLGYFRRDIAFQTYVEFWVRYTRT